MQTYNDLLKRYRGTNPGKEGREPVHATLSGFPDRVEALQSTIQSLTGQADTVHVYLNGFDYVPDFLDKENIYHTRSQDFGLLGECGKYYWCDDLAGYHFICSDKVVYPLNYVSEMVARIESHDRKMVISAGGFLIKSGFTGFETSVVQIVESASQEREVIIDLVRDNALAYHSSTIRISRHFFYQPEYSDFWFSIAGHDQGVSFICLSHQDGWIKFQDHSRLSYFDSTSGTDYRTFLIKSHFLYDDSHGKDIYTQSLNGFFDKIYVMNLDRRPDRWERLKGMAGKHGIHLERFPAVDGYKEPFRSTWEQYFSGPLATIPDGIDPLEKFTDKFTRYHHYIARICFMESKLKRKAVQSPGAFGYALSYIAILEEAIKAGYRRILIFDDDVLFHNAFPAEFVKGVKQLPENWRLLMLGAMQHQWEPWIKWYSENLYQCHGSSVASHAVGIDCRLFLPLIYYARKADLPVDEGAIFHMQNVYDNQCFIFYPNLAIQETTESDISTSAMKAEDTEKWMKVFRWERELYEYHEQKSNPE